MSLKFIKTSIPGVIIVEPEKFEDARGFFMETYHYKKYEEGGISSLFTQDNHSHSKKGILRGLHYQLHHPQEKLVHVVVGEIFDVAADIRIGSPTFGKWVGTVLSADNRQQVMIPKGFAHGFCVLSDNADVIYKCGDFYNPDDEYGISWNDPMMNIEWPLKNPSLSNKDSRNPELNQVSQNHLPIYDHHSAQ
ncbi:dTDP-4-dehydrorhamnose 3,5-epimerase [Thermodesulfobacteriota bacterium]